MGAKLCFRYESDAGDRAIKVAKQCPGAGKWVPTCVSFAGLNYAYTSDVGFDGVVLGDTPVLGYKRSGARCVEGL